MVANSTTCTKRAKRFSRVENVEWVDRYMKESRKVYGCLARDGNAAVWCASIGGEYYCGNLPWQSCRTLVIPSTGSTGRGKDLWWSVVPPPPWPHAPPYAETHFFDITLTVRTGTLLASWLPDENRRGEAGRIGGFYAKAEHRRFRFLYNLGRKMAFRIPCHHVRLA